MIAYTKEEKEFIFLHRWMWNIIAALIAEDKSNYFKHCGRTWYHVKIGKMAIKEIYKEGYISHVLKLRVRHMRCFLCLATMKVNQRFPMISFCTYCPFFDGKERGSAKHCPNGLWEQYIKGETKEDMIRIASLIAHCADHILVE